MVENSKPWSITKTHNDILDLVRLLKKPEATRDSVENVLRKRLLDEESEEVDEALEDSINLATRLLLMVSTGSFLSAGRSLTVSGETKLSMYVLSLVYVTTNWPRLEAWNNQESCKNTVCNAENHEGECQTREDLQCQEPRAHCRNQD
jgi:hypothetical protein